MSDKVLKEVENEKNKAPRIRCASCGNIFCGMLTEDTKCPRCFTKQGLQTSTGRDLIVE